VEVGIVERLLAWRQISKGPAEDRNSLRPAYQPAVRETRRGKEWTEEGACLRAGQGQRVKLDARNGAEIVRRGMREGRGVAHAHAA
jgi:hypothetical protein